MRNILGGFLLLISWLPFPKQTQAQNYLDYKPKILLVTAHPDDDALFSATVFKTTHLLGGEVDLAVMTDGEGGYHYSTLGDYIYDRQLDDEQTGRQYLPAIRKRELMAGGKIVGIRNYYFFDQKDTKYSLNIANPMSNWDTTYIKKRLGRILKNNDYDFVFTMMPTKGTHAHHKASAILLLQAVKRLPKNQRPTVMCTTITDSLKSTTSYKQLKGYPISKLMKNQKPMNFDRRQTFGYHHKLNYKIIGNWVIAEHKSQGTMQMLMNKGNVEQYWFYAMDSKKSVPKVRSFFEAVNQVPIYHNSDIHFDNE